MRRVRAHISIQVPLLRALQLAAPSFKEFVPPALHNTAIMNVFRKKQPVDAVETQGVDEDALASVEKTQMQKVFPVLAAGSGLFAEGYVQSVCLLSSSRLNYSTSHMQ